MKVKKLILSIAVSIFAAASFFALQVPQLTGPVVDQAGIISQSDYLTLDAELRKISEETGTQIAVLTIPTLEGLSIEDYSMQVAEKWKLGAVGKDDGVLICVSMLEKKVRIEVGYGLEGKLTDTKCGLIIRNVIVPNFKDGNYSGGIVAAVRAVEQICDLPNYSGNVVVVERNYVDSDAFGVMFLFVLVFVFMFSGSLSRKFPWMKWLPWMFLFNNSGSYRSNYGRRFNDFDDHFGGHSGGGFSGGGGGFGGGGASGGW